MKKFITVLLILLSSLQADDTTRVFERLIQQSIPSISKKWQYQYYKKCINDSDRSKYYTLSFDVEIMDKMFGFESLNTLCIEDSELDHYLKYFRSIKLDKVQTDKLKEIISFHYVTLKPDIVKSESLKTKLLIDLALRGLPILVSPLQIDIERLRNLQIRTLPQSMYPYPMKVPVSPKMIIKREIKEMGNKFK